MPQEFYTSKEAAVITGCTLRQLQYWREQKIIAPTVNATGRGRSVYYTGVDLVALCVLRKLLGLGMAFDWASCGFCLIKKEQPHFDRLDCAYRCFLSPSLIQLQTLELFEVTQKDLVNKALEAGRAIYPVYLDQIHAELKIKLIKV